MLSSRPTHFRLESLATRLFALMLIAILSASGVMAQENKDKQSVSLPSEGQRSPAASFEVSLAPSAQDESVVVLTIEATVIEGWHIYTITANPDLSVPTEIKFEAAGLKPADDSFVFDGTKSRADQLHGKFSWTRRYKVTEDAASYSGSGSIRFQACDATKCLPPKTLTFQLGQSSEVSVAKKSSSPDSGIIKLETMECSNTRPPAKFDTSMLFSGRTKEKLIRKCTIELDGQAIDIFLPKEEIYTIENTSADNTMVSNTSTYISIDQNGDGKLEDHEAQPTNLPIRILDSMYRVVAIAEDASSISLAKSDGPLFGTVLNRKCPEFSFQTIDGSRTISNESIKGKVTLLDIWAVT